MIRLIVNADDFGLTPGINDAILSLNQSNAVTSATLMATAPECSSAANAALMQPTLGVGCHIVLVDGVPALPPDQIRTLMGAGKSAFRPTLGAFVADLLLGRIDDAHIEAEATAQIRHLQALGIRVTHVDTHKHTHIFPRVLRPLIRAAMRCGVKALRNPFEPQWSMNLTEGAGTLRKFQVRLLNTERKTFLELTHQSGMKTTDGTIGVLATGRLDAMTLNRLIDELSRRSQLHSTYELCCHPGYQDAALDSIRTRLRGSREIEVEALQSVFTTTMNLERIHYGNLS